MLNQYKQNFVLGSVVIFLSLVFYAVVLLLINQTYHPNIIQSQVLAKKVLLNYSPEACSPEPLESMCFVTAVFTITLSMVLLYWQLKKRKQWIGNIYLGRLYIGSLIFGLIPLIYFTIKGTEGPNPFAGTMLNYMDVVAKTNWEFYFQNTYIYNHFFQFTLLVFPSIVFLFLFPFRIQSNTLHIIKIANTTLIYGFCSIIIFLVFLISAFRFPYTFENKYDFNAVFYSVVQVKNGLPLLVDNFKNTYGLYPHFVVPFINLIGGESIIGFNYIMAFLLSVCFGMLLYVLRKTINNNFLLLFGFASVFFMCYMFARLALPYDCNFAMFPIRWIWPFSLMFFGSVYLKNKIKWLYYLSFFFFSIGFLWSPDFGLLCFATLLIFYIFLEFENKEFVAIFINSLKHIGIAFLTLALTVSLYMLCIKLFYSRFPDFRILFSTINVFSNIGFGMLPLTTHPHPWMVVAFIYIVGLAYSAFHFIERKYTYRSNMVFLITVTGIACFSYYLGRSHNWNLLAVCPFAFILLAIFADEMLSIIKTHKLFYMPFSFVLFILAFSVFQTLYDYKRITDLVYEKNNKKQSFDENQSIMQNARFIKDNTTEKEKILVLTKDYYQGLYFSLSNTASSINPGFGDLFLKEDNERIVNWIKNNQHSKVFFDPENFRTSDVRYYTYLSSLYKVNKSDGIGGKLAMLTPRKKDSTSSFILKNDPYSLIHEMFDSDVEKRLSYAMGKKGKISTGDRFSVEIVFKPENIPMVGPTRSQTLLFNINDSSGFALQQNDTARNQYMICIGSRCLLIPINSGKWNYLAFEINRNIILAYSNGQLVGQAAMPTAYLNSAENLYIGNIKNSGGFFFGDIKEVKITHSSLKLEEVMETWKNIEYKFKGTS